MTGTELLQITKSLKLGRVDDFNTQRMQLNVTMNRIIENLPKETKTRRPPIGGADKTPRH